MQFIIFTYIIKLVETLIFDTSFFMKNVNLNFSKSNMQFKGKVVQSADDLLRVKNSINKGMGGLYDRLLERVGNNTQTIDGNKFILDDSKKRKVISGLKSFLGIPMDIIDAIGKKFPDSALNNSKFLQQYRESVELEDTIRALQGMQENGINALKGISPSEKNFEIMCNNGCNQASIKINSKLNELLNSSMADDKAVYDTKKERFWARIVSGFTAALFLGNDFYNKSIQKGKTKEEARKEQYLKQGQEIKENICEALTQFAVFACFSKTVNKSIWGSAVIGTLIGLVSRIVSRKTSKMPIRRIKVAEDKNNSSNLTMNEYMNAARENKIKELEEKKQTLKTKTNNKKPLLSFKNILLFCATSSAAGYFLSFLKGHTKVGEIIGNKLKEKSNKFNESVTEDIVAKKEDLEELMNILGGRKEYCLTTKFNRALYDIKSNSNEIIIGRDYKTKKIFGIEVKLKDLKALKTAPFRFVKELVSYPYKMFSKFIDAIRKTPAKQKSEYIKDEYGIKNIYKTFMEFKEKYPDKDKAKEEFMKYFDKMRLLSNNNVTSSSCNNSKIAVAAQTLGTLSGMWFNMNDEFNSSIRNGSTKYEAQKDARLRGINKFFRMTVQIIISGSLNSLFQKQYNSSIKSAAIVVALSTILTDSVSRILTGMPSRKMTKEELEKYQKEHKEGFMSGYYKFIDKLAS